MSVFIAPSRGAIGSVFPSTADWPALDLNFLLGSLDSRITFTRASSGTYFDATGAMQTAAVNVPRFDYNPVTLAIRGLLTEEARTNLLLSSATLSTQSVTVTAQAYTLSFYGTGTVTLSGASTGSLVGAGAFPARNPLTFTPSAGTLTLTVTGTVQYANLEAGSFATSWIPTTGASATRSADVGSMLLSSIPGWSAAEGAMGVEWSFPAILGTGLVSAITLDDTTTANMTSARVGQAGLADGTIRSGGVSQMDTTGIAVSPGAVKQAVAWATNDAAHACNGQIETDSSVTVPVGMTRLLFAASNIGAYWLSRVRLYPRRLSNAQLQGLTA